MNLPKKAINAVGFARWCLLNDVDPVDAAELVILAERAFKAGERYCNTGDSRLSDIRSGQFTVKAKAMGFSVSWPGLWPTLKNSDGREVYLPNL